MIVSHASGEVGTITIDRSAKRNALTTAMLTQLHEGVDALVAARVRLIVIRSSTVHFSAGADLVEWAAPSAQEASDMSRVGAEAFTALASAPMPTLAVIEGVTFGGGLELALACDLRAATTAASFAMPEVGLGNLPGWGGIPRLVATVGQTYAKELLLTAKPISGRRAADIGLVNWTVEPDQILAEVDRIVAELIATDPRAASFAKALVSGTSIDSVLASYTSQSIESRQRKQAFLDRRATKNIMTNTGATE